MNFKSLLREWLMERFYNVYDYSKSSHKHPADFAVDYLDDSGNLIIFYDFNFYGDQVSVFPAGFSPTILHFSDPEFFSKLEEVFRKYGANWK